MIILRFVLCGIFFTLAFISDIRERKIKNRLVLTFIVAGAAVNICTLDIHTIITSAAAMLIPLVLLPLFAVRAIGAGDIKALCAAGLIMGAERGINIMMYSFVCSGVIALALMIVRHNGLKRFGHFFRYLKASFLTRNFGPYNAMKRDDKTFALSYGFIFGWLIELTGYILKIIL